MYLIGSILSAALGFWLGPEDFSETPFASMTPSMLAMRIFSFSAYVGAFALMVKSLTNDPQFLWRWWPTAHRAALARVAASAIVLGVSASLAQHRDVEGPWWGVIGLVAAVAVAWCILSRRFEISWRESEPAVSSRKGD